MGNFASAAARSGEQGVDSAFLISRSELRLKFKHPRGARRLSFSDYRGPATAWREECREKLSELLGVSTPPPCNVNELRRRVLFGEVGHICQQEVSRRADGDVVSVFEYFLDSQVGVLWLRRSLSYHRVPMHAIVLP